MTSPVAEAKSSTLRLHNLNTPTLYAAVNFDPNPAKGGGDITVVDEVALLAETGPEGTLADIEEHNASSSEISLYVVRRGDTLSQIAKMFGVTTNTVLWANDLKSARATYARATSWSYFLLQGLSILSSRAKPWRP